MDDDDRSAQRLTELEIKASYAEDLLDRLNETVVRQQAQIEQLQREVARWRELLRSEDGPAPGSLRDELPPHY